MDNLTTENPDPDVYDSDEDWLLSVGDCDIDDPPHRALCERCK